MNNIEDIRRANTRELIKSYGSQAALADVMNVSAGYISQLLNVTRPINEKTARKVEIACNLEIGSLDKPLKPADKPTEITKSIEDLMDLASPNTEKKLNEIRQAAINGELTEEDIEAISEISKRMMKG